MEYTCPEHIGTGLIPLDTACHEHESNLQQWFHNRHCQIMRCPRALIGAERHHDVPLLSPRNLIEKILRNIDF